MTTIATAYEMTSPIKFGGRAGFPAYLIRKLVLFLNSVVLIAIFERKHSKLKCMQEQKIKHECLVRIENSVPRDHCFSSLNAIFKRKHSKSRGMQEKESNTSSVCTEIPSLGTTILHYSAKPRDANSDPRDGTFYPHLTPM